MVKLSFEISQEAFDLLKKINQEGSAEYRDPEYASLLEFERSVEFETGLRNVEWFLNRNFGGTHEKVLELYKYGLVDTEFDAWHTTYILTDFGKEILKNNG